MGPTEVFVSRQSRVLTGLTWVVALLVAGGFAAAGDLAQFALAAVATALGALAAWALFWRPRVEVSDGGVLLVNVLRTIHVPWPVFVEARPSWSLEVSTTTRRWSAWSAPRPSATSTTLRRGHRADAGCGDTAAAAPIGGRATADVVAASITRRHDALLAAGHLDGARRTAEQHGLREQITWHRTTIAAALVLATTAVALTVF